MRPFIFILALIVTAMPIVLAQTFATTSDGRTVALKDDGTWSYVPTTTPTTATDFRNASWGMNRSRVKARESSQPVQERDALLVYTGTISSLETYIAYFFTNDLLTRARYAISESYLNKNDYITDYNTLKTQLIKKYGAPSQDETRWKDDSLRKMSDLWGLAISNGNLSYHTSWITPRTRIVLALYGENYDVKLMAEYTSVDFGHLEEAQDLRNF